MWGRGCSFVIAGELRGAGGGLWGVGGKQSSMIAFFSEAHRLRFCAFCYANEMNSCASHFDSLRGHLATPAGIEPTSKA